MASIDSGEMFTQEQFEAMTQAERAKKKIVNLTPQESQYLANMNRKQRREWLKANKKFKPVVRDIENE